MESRREVWWHLVDSGVRSKGFEGLHSVSYALCNAGSGLAIEAVATAASRVTSKIDVLAMVLNEGSFFLHCLVVSHGFFSKCALEARGLPLRIANLPPEHDSHISQLSSPRNVQGICTHSAGHPLHIVLPQP